MKTDPTSLVGKVQRLHLQHIAWIHAKLALAFVGALYFFITPPAHVEELGDFLTYVIGAFICIGALISAVGLILSLLGPIERHEDALIVEFFGLIISVTGVVTFTVIQIKTIIGNYSDALLVRCAFVYALMAFLLARLASMSRYLKLRL